MSAQLTLGWLLAHDARHEAEERCQTPHPAGRRRVVRVVSRGPESASQAAEDASPTESTPSLDTPYEEDVLAQVLVQGKGELTLAEIATVYGCSREWVRQLEARALAKLRAHVAEHPEDAEELRALLTPTPTTNTGPSHE